LEGGGSYATEPPVEDTVIFSCDSPGELKEEDDIVVGPVGSEPAARALAGRAGKEPMHVDGGGSCLVGAPHVGAGTVQHVAPANNGGMPIAEVRTTSRVHAQRRNKPPSAMSDGARIPHALGRGAEVDERIKAALKRYREDPNRMAQNKARRLEDLKTRGARLAKLVTDDLAK
jgi:hypothetical protein